MKLKNLNRFKETNKKGYDEALYRLVNFLQ